MQISKISEKIHFQVKWERFGSARFATKRTHSLSVRPMEEYVDVKTCRCIVVYVVAQFYPWFKFYFLLFLGIVKYDTELIQRKINN